MVDELKIRKTDIGHCASTVPGPPELKTTVEPTAFGRPDHKFSDASMIGIGVAVAEYP